ncbi:hypothetical protein H0H92_006056 [Tricholoma furcatifolium]|nr:hypothetical protein H0H92_006056 [Tricholoma furcatifolium]
MGDHVPHTSTSSSSQIPPKTLPAAAYVYPVKSLLSRIQPAAAEETLLTTKPSDMDSDTHVSPDKSILSKACPSFPPNSGGIIGSSSLDRDINSGERGRSPFHTEGGNGIEDPSRGSSPPSRSRSPNFGHHAVGDSSSAQPMDHDISSAFPPQPANEKDQQSNAPQSNTSASILQEPAQSRSSRLNPSEFVHLLPMSPSNDEANFNNLFVSTVPSSSSSTPIAAPNLTTQSSLPLSDDGGVKSDAMEHVSFRFEHTENENGHHVIVGREGVLHRCEDEPICTPGSIQSFGVLIAVQEVEDTLIVRQVSENSTDLLGLPPRYLFSLECFTDTLPESQANTLWENISYLTEVKDDDDSGPQVFLLSGWGASGSETTGHYANRRSWMCWCAIHRPTVNTEPSSPVSDLIIMEFELERDHVNPLYPPVRLEEGSPSTSPLSGRTLASGSVDFGLDRQIATGDNLESVEEDRDDGDGERLPSTQDILESTAVHSKPIPALERLRKMTSTSSSVAPNNPSRRLHRRSSAKGNDHLNVGMMDMFAVLSQINEQLGAVESLELFLKAVVGIVKDLTQFHRVMVYQFDELWNGQVVAELVDWKQTHNLYKGSSFVHPQYALVFTRRREVLIFPTDKVRILYDRSQTAARIVVRNKEDLEVPLTGYIVSNTDELLTLFDADSGILVIGKSAKIIGANQHGQETLIMAEYLRLKRFKCDFYLGIDFSADCKEHIALYKSLRAYVRTSLISTGKQVRLQAIAGLLLVPLSASGTDFIAFLRKGQPREVRWAGKPNKDSNKGGYSLEPRRSFEIWSEVVAGHSRAWTDEQMDTAGVLALVYGKVPVADIVGQDLTRLESGRSTSSKEPFDLRDTIEVATRLYQREAKRRNLDFRLELEDSPRSVVGDAKKIQTVVQNLTANALKYTTKGVITVSCTVFDDVQKERAADQTIVDIAVADTGSGMPTEKLEEMFQDLEEVGTLEPKMPEKAGLGLGLAVVARIVEQLDGQLRVDSQVGGGSRFSFLIPLALSLDPVSPPVLSLSPVLSGACVRYIHPSRKSNGATTGDELNNFVEAMVGNGAGVLGPTSQTKKIESIRKSEPPIKAVKVDTFASEVIHVPIPWRPQAEFTTAGSLSTTTRPEHPPLRILIVEDNDVNRLILAKRLVLDGHTVVNTTNGQEALDKLLVDREFDTILMDIQMPILNGFEATQKIRELEQASPLPLTRQSHRLHGRLPIFAVSASLVEKQHDELRQIGMDGWILKPIDFRRLKALMRSVVDSEEKTRDTYRLGYNWEEGGWLLQN